MTTCETNGKELKFEFTIFTETIMHLVYLPKFCITIVFDFSSDDFNTPEKTETKAMQNLGRGVSKLLYGLCENGE